MKNSIWGGKMIKDILLKIDGLELRDNLYYKENHIGNGVFEVEVEGINWKIKVEDGSIVTWEEYKYSADKNLIYKKSYKDNMYHGEIIEYAVDYSFGGNFVKRDIDGNPILLLRANYREGIFEGEYEEYNQEGKLVKKGIYKNNKCDGYWIENLQTGEKKSETTYRDGIKEGIFRQYKDGYLYVSGENSNGKVDGQIDIYYPTGATRGINVFQEGILTYAEFYYEDGSLMEKQNYLDGKKEGLIEVYYPNGVIKSQIDYRNGMIDGQYREYTKEGKIAISKGYKEDKLDGEEVKYDINGLVIRRCQYKDGKVDGLQENYFYTNKNKEDYAKVDNLNNPILKDRYYYKNGKKHGDYSIYTEEGNLSEWGSYYEDERDGTWVQRDYKGNARFKVGFHRGKEHGEYIDYKDGIMTFRGNYEYGSKDGEHVYYYPQGTIKEKEVYGNNTLKSRESYYESGNLKERVKFVGGSIEGIKEGYYEDGSLREKSNYSRGKKDGLSEIYNEKGYLVLKGLYQRGKRFEVEEYSSFGTLKKTIRTQGDIEEEKRYNSDGGLKSVVINKTRERKKEICHYHINGKIKEVKEVVYNLGINGMEVIDTSRNNDIDGIRHGEYKSYYISGQLEKEGIYNNGLLTGIYKTYYENGQLKCIKDFDQKDFKENSYYYANGQLKTIDRYFEGELEGEHRVFYPNGNVKLIKNYIKGKKEGKVEFYYVNGQLECEYMQLRDEEGRLQKVGEQKYYYPCGNLESLVRYEDNRIIENKLFYRNGQIKLDKKYIGNRTELYFYFDTGVKRYERFIEGNTVKNIAYNYQGKKVYEDNHVDGEFHGKVIKYYKNGQIHVDFDNHMGERHGEFKSYFKDGTLAYDVNYIDGNKEGEGREYFKDGSIKIEFNYKNNEYEGIYKEYYFGGQIKKLSFYKEGERVEEEKEYYKDGSLKSWWQEGIDGKKEEYYELYEGGSIKGRRTGEKGKEGCEEFWYTRDGILVEKIVYGKDNRKIIERYYEDGKIKELEDHYKRIGCRQDERLEKVGVLNDGLLNGRLFEFGKEDNIIGDYSCKDNKFDGSFVRYYESGEVCEEGHAKDGDYSDWIKEFYKDGELKKIWRTGKFFSPPKEYYEDGSIKSKFVTTDDEEHKYYVEYYENGEVKKRVEVMEEGYHDYVGSYEEYYESGQIKEKTRYKNCRVDEERISYYESGIVKKRIDKFDEFGNGKITYYYPNGEVRREEVFEGNKIIKRVSFDLDRNKTIEPFVGDKINGSVEIYYANGEKYGEVSVVDGERDGEALYYYDNGTLLVREFYVEGLLHGDRFDYYESGSIKSKLSYVYGKAEGFKSYFTEDGELEKSEFYQDGKRVEKERLEN